MSFADSRLPATLHAAKGLGAGSASFLEFCRNSGFARFHFSWFGLNSRQVPRAPQFGQADADRCRFDRAHCNCVHDPCPSGARRHRAGRARATTAARAGPQTWPARLQRMYDNYCGRHPLRRSGTELPPLRMQRSRSRDPSRLRSRPDQSRHRLSNHCGDLAACFGKDVARGGTGRGGRGAGGIRLRPGGRRPRC